MPYVLSRSTRVLLAGLLVIGLLFQIAFSTTRLIGHGYAHNGRLTRVQENWGDAAWFFRQANDWSPYNAHWWYWLAVSERNGGEVDASITALEQSLKLAPAFVSALHLASNMMIETDNGEIALQLIDRAENLVPNSWESAYSRGAIAFTSGYFPDAMDSLLISDRNSLEPRTHVLGLLSQAAFESGRVELAANTIDRAVASSRDSAWHWMLSGEIHRVRGNSEISRVSYERAIDLYSANESGSLESMYYLATLHVRLAYLYATRSEIDEAVRSFFKATSYYADLATYSDLLSQIHLELLATLSSRSAEDQLQWACVLSSAQLWSDAIEVFSRLDSAAHDWTALARYSYGMALRKSGQPEEALVQFRALPSSDLIPAKAYAETLYEAGQPAAARFEYAKIPTLFSLSDAERSEIESRIEALAQP